MLLLAADPHNKGQAKSYTKHQAYVCMSTIDSQSEYDIPSSVRLGNTVSSINP